MASEVDDTKALPSPHSNGEPSSSLPPSFSTPNEAPPAAASHLTIGSTPSASSLPLLATSPQVKSTKPDATVPIPTSAVVADASSEGVTAIPSSAPVASDTTIDTVTMFALLQTNISHSLDGGESPAPAPHHGSTTPATAPSLGRTPLAPVNLEVIESPPEEQIQDGENFVPSLGSWAKPLYFKPPPTPPEPSTPRDYDCPIVGNQLAALWPSLNDEILNKKPKGKYPSRSLQPPVEKLPKTELKSDGNLCFPWAARLSPESRNLYRAATPTYRLDGTPEISIPSKVLKLGPENKDEYIIGKFHKCSLPPGGLVHAVVNKIWGRSCKISCKKIGESSYMFHIPHEATRHWVIQRGVWHIDDCLLFVLPWTTEGSFKITEISTLPVWVNLKNIPDCCYSRLGISHIASGLGEPIVTHKPRLDPTSMGEAKILVEMELDRDFPKLIALDDKQGKIFLVDVEYTWIPTMCARCGNLGHKEKRCLLPAKPATDPIFPQRQQEATTDIPVVDIDRITQQKVPSTSSSPSLVLQNETALEAQNARNLLPVLQPTDDVTQELPADASYALQVYSGTPLNRTSSNSSSFSSKEKPADPQSSFTTSATLVDSVSTPIDTYNMESAPSNNISNTDPENPVVGLKTVSPNHCAFESPSRFTVLGDEDEVEIEPPFSFGLTRGGRESKPPIKFQNLEWELVRGRGKRGRRGRGTQR